MLVKDYKLGHIAHKRIYVYICILMHKQKAVLLENTMKSKLNDHLRRK